MSSRETVGFHRRQVVAALGLGLLAGGCFTPLYAERAPGTGSVRDALGQVEILRVEGRVGHEIREALIFELTGGAGNPVGAPYQMTIAVQQSSTATSIDRTSGRALVEMITVIANYTVAEVASKRPVLRDQAFAKVTIDRGAQLFARDRAVRDAQNNAAKVIAEQMRARLATLFVAGPPPTLAEAPAAAPGSAWRR